MEIKDVKLKKSARLKTILTTIKKFLWKKWNYGVNVARLIDMYADPAANKSLYHLQFSCSVQFYASDILNSASCMRLQIQKTTGS